MAPPKKKPVVPEAPPVPDQEQTNFDNNGQPLPFPDKSGLDPDAKIDSLVNLLQCLPPQYLEGDRMKDTLYSLCRFMPTDEQIETARERIKNPVPRFPMG